MCFWAPPGPVCVCVCVCLGPGSVYKVAILYKGSGYSGMIIPKLLLANPESFFVEGFCFGIIALILV